MKKNLCLIMTMIICLFAGIVITNAAKIKLGNYDCTNPEVDKNDNTKKYVTCTISVVAEEAGSFKDGDTQTLVVKYNEPTDTSDFELVDTFGTIGGNADTIQKNGKEGGTFVYHFSSKTTLEKDKEYTLAKIKFTAKNDNNKDCGGTVTFGGSSSGSGDDKEVTDVPKTGVSIPVAIIGFGTVAGLAIYSVSSRKTKMHRI